MLTLDLLDLHSMPDLDRNHDTLISAGELDAAIERVSDAVSRNFLVRAEGPPPETTVERYQLTTETRVRLEVVYRFPGPITTLEVTSTLDSLDAWAKANAD